ncbi:MAG: hypothetical protein K2Y40_04730 [Reyranella sp.]|nr:hypothetical protein [Reyranella sp.]
MTTSRSKTAKARTLPAAAKRRTGRGESPVVAAQRGEQGDEIVVWLRGKGLRPRRIGSVNRRLAADARRHGQDLVGDLVDEALREVDRQTLPRAARP